MNYIFFFLVSILIIVSLYNRTREQLVKGMFEGCNLAVKIAFSLIGIMAFWLGVMRIAERAGFITFISKLLYPLLKYIFPPL